MGDGSGPAGCVPFPDLSALRTACNCPAPPSETSSTVTPRHTGVAGFAYGVSPMPWSTFLALNFVAAGIWACAVVAAGYAFGRVSEKVMTQASSGLGVVMLVAFLGLSWLLSKRLERSLERG